jgi:hypothetical protein
MPILKNCFDRVPPFEGGRMLAKRVEDSVELGKARQAGGAVMPAEMECSDTEPSSLFLMGVSG